MRVLAGSSLPVSLGGTPYRDGSYECYAGVATVADEPGGTAALLLALLEDADPAYNAASTPPST